MVFHWIRQEVLIDRNVTYV